MGKKIIIVTILLAIVAGVGFLADYLLSVQRYKDMIANITYVNVNASDVPDGTYIGDYDAGFISAKVEVAVENGMITNITLLEHHNERGKSAEGIVNEIVAKQKIDVDAVSGATNSSIVIKKAVDNALSNANSYPALD